MTRPEQAAIQWLCAALGDYAKSRTVIARIPAELDAQQLRRFVEAQGLEGFLYAAEDAGAGLAEAQPQWRTKAMAILLFNLRALRATVALFRLLDAAGIPAVAMRGVVLANRDYASPEERSMRDVDILLMPDAREAVLQTLARAGHQPCERLRSQDVFQIEGVVLELHWSLLSAKRYRGCIDGPAWLQSRTALDTPDGRIYVLSKEYELIGLILHAFIHHELTIFKQLLDIALFMGQDDLDWEWIAAWCKRTRLSRMFALSLHLVDALFHLQGGRYQSFFPVPASAEKRIQAWIQPFSGRPGLAGYLQLKSNMLYAAETPERYFRQWIGFFSATELRDLRRRYLQTRQQP